MAHPQVKQGKPAGPAMTLISGTSVNDSTNMTLVNIFLGTHTLQVSILRLHSLKGIRWLNTLGLAHTFYKS